MRIQPFIMNSVFYVYPSEDSANSGVTSGATGFFVGRDKKNGKLQPNGQPEHFIYAVTNNHVMARIPQSGSAWIRLNSKDGRFFVREIPAEKWVRHPGGYDIQAALIDEDEDEEYYLLPTTCFITRDELRADNWHVGPGDTTFMVGRFITHEGKRLNTPTVRYGNISLNPDTGDAIPNQYTGTEEEVFLVESRSYSGYSGSPVFVSIPPYDDRGKPPPPQPPTTFVIASGPVYTHIWLLGINSGHTEIYRPVFVKDSNGNRQKATLNDSTLESEYNSGMLRVIPAWRIDELLDCEELTKLRVDDDMRAREKEEGVPQSG